MSPNAERLFARAYRPTIVALVVLAASAWVEVLAVGKFTAMIDARAEAVVAAKSAGPLAQQADFERRISDNTNDIRALAAAVKQTDSNVNRILGIIEEQRAQRRSDLPVQLSGPRRTP